MEKTSKYLAIDLGAESGRAVIGSLENDKIILEEIHRFRTGMLFQNNHYYWNIYRFYEEIIKSIELCVNQFHVKPHSLAIDTWGVDFGLISNDGSLIRIPYAYRDPQSEEGMRKFLSDNMSAKQIYDLTGIAIQSFNSVYHLHALKQNDDIALRNANKLLFIPDLLNYFLTGIEKSEFTFATTSQLYNPITKKWESKLFESIQVPETLMAEIIQPGSKIGFIKDDIVKNIGVKPFLVNAVCSHDTGSAVVAIPATGDDWAFISSGTWSLMGVELPEPVINSKSQEYNFTNEGGAEGTFRFLKNIMGLWLLQQCRSSWTKSGNEISYPDLVKTALSEKAFKSFIDPDFEGFFNPDDMPTAIDQYCTSTNQNSPETVGGYVLTILEGLAFKYRLVLDQLKETTSRKINKIHIIGGGSQNELLCQFTANVTGLEVIAGPAEGTATGNLLMQAKTMGDVSSVEEIRKIVANSFELKTYLPENVKEWDEGYGVFRKICSL